MLPKNADGFGSAISKLSGNTLFYIPQWIPGNTSKTPAI